MDTRDSVSQNDPGPSSLRELEQPTAGPSTQLPLNKSDVSGAFAHDLISLSETLLYVLRLVLVSICHVLQAAASSIQSHLSLARHPRPNQRALLPLYIDPIIPGSDPPSSPPSRTAAQAFRDAVLSSFTSTPSSTPTIPSERTPLLRPGMLAILDTAATHPHLRHLHITSPVETHSHPHSAISSTHGLDTPSATRSPTPSEDSSPSCSTPSSSNSSFTFLRSALKKPPTAPSSPRIGVGLDLEKHPDRPNSALSKTVRFNPDGDETHFFERASWEEPPKSTVSPLGKWKKNGGTIVWQDGPDRAHKKSTSRSQVDAESEEEAYSRALFGKSLPGRIMYSLLLGSRPPSVTSSAGPSSSSATDGGVMGRRLGHGSSMGWADEGRWKDGMY